MYLGRLWILSCLLAASGAGAAVVYKWTDANGLLHYSDQPAPGAEKMLTGVSSVRSDPFAAAARTAPAAKTVAALKPKKDVASTRIREISITSPTPEQTFFGGEAVPIHLSLNPDLKDGQTITWSLNGKILDDQPNDAVAFALVNLDRGSYTVLATITDSDTGESQTSAPVNFNVHQSSTLSPLHPKPRP